MRRIAILKFTRLLEQSVCKRNDMYNTQLIPICQTNNEHAMASGQTITIIGHKIKLRVRLNYSFVWYIHIKSYLVFPHDFLYSYCQAGKRSYRSKICVSLQHNIWSMILFQNYKNASWMLICYTCHLKWKKSNLINKLYFLGIISTLFEQHFKIQAFSFPSLRQASQWKISSSNRKYFSFSFDHHSVYTMPNKPNHSFREKSLHKTWSSRLDYNVRNKLCQVLYKLILVSPFIKFNLK